jgi:hypothetical protein
MPAVATARRLTSTPVPRILAVMCEAERRGAVARPDEVQAQQPETAPGDETATRGEMLVITHGESILFRQAPR